MTVGTRGNESPRAQGRVLITGGTGFVGSNIRAALGDRPLRILVRDRKRAAALATGDVEIVEGDVTEPESLRGIMNGCQAVIHLVAIIEEQRGATFDKVIREGTENMVAEATRIGSLRFIHMSAMGAGPDHRYPYLKAKWDAEQAVRSSGLPWTIFRPSVIFGPGDGFIRVLANVVKRTPVVPVVGSGKNRFQPVAVHEVAAAFVRALDDDVTIGRTFELGGPEILTYEELIEIIADRLGKRRRIVHLPVGLMKLAVTALRPLPRALRPPVTSEQLRMLALDNCSLNSATSRFLGRQPTRLRDGIDYLVHR